MQPIMTLKEVCEYLRIHNSTVYRMIKRGEMPGVMKVGSDYRFIRADIDRWRLEQSATVGK